jgi:tRNA pseudouridine-54 N-methylase
MESLKPLLVGDAADAPPPALLRHFVMPFSRLPCRHGAAGGLDLVKTRGDVWCRCLTATLLVSRGTRNDTTFTAVALAQPPVSPNHALHPAAAAAASAAPPEPPLFLRACGRHVRALRPEQSTCAAILSAALPPPPSSGALPALRASGALNSMEGRRGCCMGLHAGLGGLREALGALALPAVCGARPHALVLEEGAEAIGAVLARVLGGGASGGAGGGSGGGSTSGGAGTDGGSGSSDGGGGGGGGAHLPPTALIILLGDNEGLTGEHEAEAERALRACGVPVARASLGPTELLASQAITILHYELDRAVGGSAVAKKAFDANDKYADLVRPCFFCAPEHPDLPPQ